MTILVVSVVSQNGKNLFGSCSKLDSRVRSFCRLSVTVVNWMCLPWVTLVLFPVILIWTMLVVWDLMSLNTDPFTLFVRCVGAVHIQLSIPIKVKWSARIEINACYIMFYIITKSIRALWLVNQLWVIVPVNPRQNRASSELLYKSNRPQVSMGYRLINHLGCW